MFGTFRYNDSLKEAEYVELSRESGVDARGYTLLVSLHDPHHARVVGLADRHHRHAHSAVPARQVLPASMIP